MEKTGLNIPGRDLESKFGVRMSEASCGIQMLDEPVVHIDVRSTELPTF